MAYTKEFLIEAYISRYLDVVEDIDALCLLEENAVKLYDRVGRDEFRKYASLDAEAIRIFNNG
jgi:hypothetical protein